MTDLTPIPELLAAARRVATGDWTVEHNEDAFGPNMDPNLRTLVDAGLAVLYFPPTRLRLDYWTLTATGRAWLATHDKEAGR